MSHARPDVGHVVRGVESRFSWYRADQGSPITTIAGQLPDQAISSRSSHGDRRHTALPGRPPNPSKSTSCPCVSMDSPDPPTLALFGQSGTTIRGHLQWPGARRLGNPPDWVIARFFPARAGLFLFGRLAARSPMASV